jgi:hypothetical protein
VDDTLPRTIKNNKIPGDRSASTLLAPTPRLATGPMIYAAAKMLGVVDSDSTRASWWIVATDKGSSRRPARSTQATRSSARTFFVFNCHREFLSDFCPPANGKIAFAIISGVVSVAAGASATAEEEEEQQSSRDEERREEQQHRSQRGTTQVPHCERVSIACSS